MTEACLRLVSECDFKAEEVMELELLLLRHSPDQLARFFRRKDKNGEHRLEWFRPFFERGYLADNVDVRLPGPPDAAFWEAYRFWSFSSGKRPNERMTTFQLPDLWTMSRDIYRMAEAYEKSKVKSIPYVARVYESMETRKAPERTRVEFEVGNSGSVVTGRLE